MRMLQGVVLMVNTFLPALLVCACVGVYVFRVEPLVESWNRLELQISREFKNRLKAPHVDLGARIAMLDRQYETIIALSTDYCGAIGRIASDSFAVHEASLKREHMITHPLADTSWRWRDGLEGGHSSPGLIPVALFEDRSRARIAELSARIDDAKSRLDDVTDELNTARNKLRKVKDETDVLDVAIGELKKIRQETTAFLEVAQGKTCNVISPFFEKTFTIVGDVISPVVAVAGFSVYVDDAYTVVKESYRNADIPTTIKIDDETRKTAVRLGRGVSSIVTALTYLGIGLAGWLTITYLLWVRDRLKRGWKLVAG